jgi:hypothetical protein
MALATVTKNAKKLFRERMAPHRKAAQAMSEGGKGITRRPSVTSGSPTYPLHMSAALTADRRTLTIAAINATADPQSVDISLAGFCAPRPRTPVAPDRTQPGFGQQRGSAAPGDGHRDRVRRRGARPDGFALQRRDTRLLSLRSPLVVPRVRPCRPGAGRAHRRASQVRG